MVRPLSINRPLIKCRCGKTYSPTKQAAVKTRKHVAQRNGGTNPVRFYQCRYGGWHWTRHMYDLKTCASCRGPFRPTDADPKADYCDTCAEIRTDQETARKAARRLAAIARQQEYERRQNDTRARIINECAPSPAKMASRRKGMNHA